MEFKRQAANRKPPESSKVKFLANDFAAEFDREGLAHDLREGLKFFKEKGVLTLGKDVESVKYWIKDYQPRKLRFKEIQRLIKEGRPIVGGIDVNSSLDNSVQMIFFIMTPKDTDGEGHAVVFIGYGWRAGSAYLIFLNSYGTKKFSSSGFERVYLDHVHILHTIHV
ncbi:hypothetical protein SETIT_9G175900v2 [Setaria italica]|uniref:Peptidase C1A papain C-terminal domain-containing protein n=1 Tax=Setaria italica TaxID=4555 RepID=A0A368SHM9_SETIT|nr:hypothetical protein SETIT_9G175900v2 [Setaria italica]